MIAVTEDIAEASHLKWKTLSRTVIVVSDKLSGYYNTRRSHMERHHLTPIRDVPDEIETLTMDQIKARSYVCELVRSFERRAA